MDCCPARILDRNNSRRCLTQSSFLPSRKLGDYKCFVCSGRPLKKCQLNVPVEFLMASTASRICSATDHCSSVWSERSFAKDGPLPKSAPQERLNLTCYRCIIVSFAERAS
jgi:hypothetical protein